jgi:cytochrome c553
LPGNLWGDEDYATSGLYELTNEVFEALGLTYQAPYYKGGFNYEPANDTISDGSNLPNIISFCLDCHSHTNVPSTERGGYLTQIDWSNSGNWHGTAPKGATGMGYPIAPYTNSSRNYVLSCTDCHEPHGSENEWLLRTSVNGKDNISVTFAGDWWEFCTACHVLTNGTTMYHRQRPESYYPGCPVCHEHNEANPNNNF